MSLEQAIERLVSAVEANTRELQGRSGADKPTPTGDTGQVNSSGSAAAARGPGRPPKSKSAESPTVVAPTAPVAQQAAVAGGVTYPDVKAAIMLLAQQKGHAAAMQVLASLGVSHGNQLTPEQWPAAKAALDAATAGGSAGLA